MNLAIIDINQKKYYRVEWLEIKTPSGNITIQDEHAPMIIELSPNNDIFFKIENGEEKSFKIKQGFLHVTRILTKVLITA
jgi:F0F1-type ATP synthase epsilon subunit